MSRLCSLISAFIVRCLDSIIHVLNIPKISGLLLVSVAEQAGLSLTWPQTPEDRFSRDLTHFICLFEIRKLAVCFLWLSLPGHYRVTDEVLLAETT